MQAISNDTKMNVNTPNHFCLKWVLFPKLLMAQTSILYKASSSSKHVFFQLSITSSWSRSSILSTIHLWPN